MPTLVHLTAADVRRVPWKNGRGVTEELLVLPESATFARGDFDVRISKATVSEPGPFSSFPGFDRVLVVTAGAGLRLAHGAAAPGATIGPFEPYAFSGDEPTAATLVDGPVEDFNVFVRRGRRRAHVDVSLPGRCPRPSGRLGAGDALVHLTAGTLELGLDADARRWRLAPGESLLVRDAREGDALVLEGVAAVLLLVRLAR